MKEKMKRNKYDRKKNEWASACRATSSEQFVSYIMATILFDEMIIINDYHASFVLEKAVHMKVCYSTGTHIPT